jgi:hypothetical protein
MKKYIILLLVLIGSHVIVGQMTLDYVADQIRYVNNNTNRQFNTLRDQDSGLQTQIDLTESFLQAIRIGYNSKIDDVYSRLILIDTNQSSVLETIDSLRSNVDLKVNELNLLKTLSEVQENESKLQGSDIDAGKIIGYQNSARIDVLQTDLASYQIEVTELLLQLEDVLQQLRR